MKSNKSRIIVILMLVVFSLVLALVLIGKNKMEEIEKNKREQKFSEERKKLENYYAAMSPEIFKIKKRLNPKGPDMEFTFIYRENGNVVTEFKDIQIEAFDTDKKITQVFKTQTIGKPRAEFLLLDVNFDG